MAVLHLETEGGEGMTLTAFLRDGLLCLCAWGVVLEAIPLYVDQDPWQEVEL